MSGYHKLQSETSEESTDGGYSTTTTCSSPPKGPPNPPSTTQTVLSQAKPQRPRSVSVHNTLIVTPPLSPGKSRSWNPSVETVSGTTRRCSLGPGRSKSPSQMTSPQDDISKRMNDGMTISRSPNRTSPNLSRSPTRTPVRRRRGQRPSSPHHNRSQSVKTYSRTPKLETAFRPRLGSVPTENLLFPGRYGPHFDPDMDDSYYCLRSFVVTASGGVINRGDSLRRRAHSYNSVAGSEKSYPSSNCTVGSSDCESSGLVEGYDEPLAKIYKVQIVGQTGVGKTALITQFLSSEYMNAYDASLDDEMEISVSVLLDGEESEMVFSEYTSSGSKHEPYNMNKPDAFVVVYSVNDKESFKVANKIIKNLRDDISTDTKAHIMVANKIDLVRARDISYEDGKAKACEHDVKYIETSAAINHNVDELLVGILTQIRLKLQMLDNANKKKQRVKRKPASMRTRNRRSSKGIIDKLLGIGENVKSKSCDNLYVL